MKTVHTEKAPAAIGPYSQAVCAGGFVYTSGQIALDPASGALVSGGIAAQTAQACRSLGEVLSAAGSGWENVVKTTCYLADMADFSAFNAVYETFFVSKPARSCVAVKTLPRGALCEIEAVAVIGEGKE